jgi:hypothetical protein
MTALILTIAAIIAGPILAVRAQKLIESFTQRRQHKDLLFKTLMSTRDNRLSLEHVRALNMIDIVFSDKSKKDKAVVEAWSEYRDHLHAYPQKPPTETGKNLSEAQATTYQAKCDAWQLKSTDILANLLDKMAACLNYHFDKVLLKRGAYTPTGYSETELDQYIIRKGVTDLFLGLKSIPIHIVKTSLIKEKKNTQQEKPNNNSPTD